MDIITKIKNPVQTNVKSSPKFTNEQLAESWPLKDHEVTIAGFCERLSTILRNRRKNKQKRKNFWERRSENTGYHYVTV